jgi:hypothetical protein
MGNLTLLDNALPVVMLFRSQYEEIYIFSCIMKFVLHHILQFSKCNLWTWKTWRPTVTLQISSRLLTKI